MVFRACMNCTHEQLSLLFTYQKKKKKYSTTREEEEDKREQKGEKRTHKGYHASGLKTINNFIFNSSFEHKYIYKDLFLY